MVYVQNIAGSPLMPCCEAKAKHLLREHRARIVKKAPFTIRLRFVVDDITACDAWCRRRLQDYRTICIH